MTKSQLTFYDYIYSISNSECTERFKSTFSETDIPNKMVSSKYLIQNLTIRNNVELIILKNAYMEYHNKLFTKKV